MRRRTVVSAIVTMAALGLPEVGLATTEVAGVQIADQIKFGGQTLILNGVGIRKKFGFSVYVCGLYLQSPCSTPADIIALPGAKRILLGMVRDISSDEMGDAFLAGIRHNSTREQTQILGMQLVQLGQLSVTFPRLRTGDVLTIDFEPGIGSSMSMNGRIELEPTPGPQLFEALLRIWIGEHPADDTLKDRLLRKKAFESTLNTGFRSGG